VGPPPAPFAWQGLGGKRLSPEAGEGGEWTVGPGAPWPGSEVAEPPAPAWSGDPGALGPGRLAGVAYAPAPERPVVPLSGRSGEVRPFRLLGQYKGALVLVEGPDGLYLVDQHVAHERILYERLRRSLARERTPSQRLVDPPLLELSGPERMRLLELAEELEACGFGVAELSGDTVALTAVPPPLSAAEAERLLLELAASDDDAEGGAEALRRRVLDALAATLSCKAAVKMHHPLSPEEMEALLAELFAAEDPYACPHGRPIVLKMSDADLERRFGRR
jgi:DNA mismatch repair protein MutL